MKEVTVEQAVGTVLAHDLTQIIPGEYKGPKFKKGHIITEDDIPLLLSMGKRHLFVLEKDDNDVHENEAAYRIASKAAGDGIELTDPSEGKIELKATCDGLLKIDRDRLYELVSQDEIMFATIHENIVVRKGEKLAGTRIIPLFIAEELLQQAESILEDGPVIKIVPLRENESRCRYYRQRSLQRYHRRQIRSGACEKIRRTRQQGRKTGLCR